MSLTPRHKWAALDASAGAAIAGSRIILARFGLPRCPKRKKACTPMKKPLRSNGSALTRGVRMKTGEMTMLRNGCFIKEPPPRIGSHYVREHFPRDYTEEERFMQDVLLDKKPSREAAWFSFLSRLLKI